MNKDEIFALLSINLFSIYLFFHVINAMESTNEMNIKWYILILIIYGFYVYSKMLIKSFVFSIRKIMISLLPREMIRNIRYTESLDIVWLDAIDVLVIYIYMSLGFLILVMI